MQVFRFSSQKVRPAQHVERHIKQRANGKAVYCYLKENV